MCNTGRTLREGGGNHGEPSALRICCGCYCSLPGLRGCQSGGARRRQVSTGRGGMAISILPRSSLGWWSVGLAIAFCLGSRCRDGAAWRRSARCGLQSELWLSVLKIVFIGVSGASFVAGLISVIKRKEPSVLVLAGMLITLWLGLIGMVGHLFME